MQFEWDENKNQQNFENERFTYESPRETLQGKEMRHVAVGEVAGKTIAVIYTVRHEKIRIISARRAWKKEERAYRALLGRQPA